MMPRLTAYGFDRATGAIVRPCGVRTLSAVRRRWRRRQREMPEAIEDLDTLDALAPIARLVDPEEAPDAPPTPDDEGVPEELAAPDTVMLRPKAEPDFARFAQAMRAKAPAAERPVRAVDTSTAEAAGAIALAGRIGFGMRAELRERSKATWCEQCQQLVTPAAARSCASRWCKAGEKAA